MFSVWTLPYLCCSHRRKCLSNRKMQYNLLRYGDSLRVWGCQFMVRLRETIWHRTFQVASLLTVLVVSPHVARARGLQDSQNVILTYGAIRERMFVGVDYWAGVTASFFTERDLSFLKDVGIEIVRMEFGLWSEANLKTMVPLVTVNGIEVLGLLMREDLVGNIDAWGDWVYNTVLEYKSMVKVWEIWNEPDWQTGFTDDPEGYTGFLKRAYTRAKEADPTCTILGGSLVGAAEAPLDYLEAMYDNGAKDYMDAVSIHPYCDPNPPEYPNEGTWGNAFWKLQWFRDLMVERGDGHKKIWITEFGWPTNDVSDEEQADYLVRALTMAKNWGWVETVVIFSWMDSASANLYFGLVREKYSPPYTSENFCKPSLFAIKDFISNSTKTT